MIWIILGGFPLIVLLAAFLWGLWEDGDLGFVLGQVAAFLAVSAAILAVFYGLQQVGAL